jgi:hypothetical protein
MRIATGEEADVRPVERRAAAELGRGPFVRYAFAQSLGS